MSDYQELYKKYRPRSWDDIIGQDDVVESLKASVESGNMPTAYGFFGSHGCGKALHKDTLIPTPDGFVSMGDLSIGDTVLGSDSSPVKITDKYCPMDDSMYVMRFVGEKNVYEEVYSSGGHLWEVVDTAGEKHVLSSKEIFNYMHGTVSELKIARRGVNFNDLSDVYLSYIEDCVGKSHTTSQVIDLLGLALYISSFNQKPIFSVNHHGNRDFTFFLKSSDFSAHNGASNDSTILSSLTKLASLMRILGGHVEIFDADLGVDNNWQFAGDTFSIKWRAIPDYIFDTDSFFADVLNKENLVVDKIEYAEPDNNIFTSLLADNDYHYFVIDKVGRHDVNKHGNSVSNREDYFCISVDAEDKLFLCTESFIPTHNTSTAKVLAKAINCENSKDAHPCGVCSSCLSVDNDSSLDVFYESMANAGGAENVRAIMDKSEFQPHGNKGIFILDEVHNLSKAAFDAMLIPLEREDSPSVFILCSTEPEKIPKTIHSRIQGRNFQKVENRTLAQYVKTIADNENINVSNDVLSEVIRRGKGSVRDTLKFLEEVRSGNGMSESIAAESDYAKQIFKVIFGSANDFDCLAKVLTIVAEADNNVSIESLLHRLFKLARKTIVNLQAQERTSVGSRNNAFPVLRDMLVLFAQAIDKCKNMDGTEERFYLESAIAQLLTMHSVSADVWDK